MAVQVGPVAMKVAGTELLEKTAHLIHLPLLVVVLARVTAQVALVVLVVAARETTVINPVALERLGRAMLAVQATLTTIPIHVLVVVVALEALEVTTTSAVALL
jgi:hypothetical protein